MLKYASFVTAILFFFILSHSLDAKNNSPITQNQLEKIEISRTLISNAVLSAKAHHLVFASYQFKLARQHIPLLPNTTTRTQYEQMLKLSTEALNDFSLTPTERINNVCELEIKLHQSLNEMQNNLKQSSQKSTEINLDEAPIDIEQAIYAIEALSVTSLKRIPLIRSFLKPYLMDFEIIAADEYLLQIEISLSDQTKNLAQKLVDLKEDVRLAANALRRSEEFRRQCGIQYEGAKATKLGLTDFFSLKETESHSLEISNATLARGLKIIARDDTLFVSDVLVLLSDGKKEKLAAGFTLRKNGSRILDIDLKEKEIKSIEIIANSAALFGTKARAEILALK